MPIINQLSGADQLASGDSVPFYSVAQGDTRRFTMSTLEAYMADANFVYRYFQTWAEFLTSDGWKDQDIFLVSAEDTGTHDSVAGDVGEAAGQTPNVGVFRYSILLETGVRISDTDAQVAKYWADQSAASAAAALVTLSDVNTAGATQIIAVQTEGAIQTANAAAWAQGTLPGGPGTKSALEWAGVAETALNDRMEVLPLPSAQYSVEFGTPGGARSAGLDLAGLWEFMLGVKSMNLTAADNANAGGIDAKSDLSRWAFSLEDKTTGALIAGVQKDGTIYPSTETVSTAPIEHTERLRNLRSGLAYLALGGSALVHIILDGDSWFDSKGYGTTDAITRFYAESGLTNAGPGWIGLGSAITGGTAIHGTALNNISVTRSGTWTELYASASSTSATAENFPGYDAAQSAADGSIYTLTGSTIGNCTSLMLFCGKGSGIEQSWDGAVWNAVTVTAGSGSTTATIDMTGKTNTLRLRCANGAVVAGLFGLTAASGVVFSNLSNSGSTASQKAAVQANADYQAMISAMPGDAVCVVLQLGLNDTARGAVNSAIAANVGVVADGYRTAFDGFPACDILAACQPNTPLSVQDLLSPLVRAWAEDNDAAFLDWQGYFGIPASSGDYAAYARNYTSGAASTALPLLEVDTTYRHPSPTADLVAAGKSAVLSGAGVVAHTLSNILLARSN